MEARYWKSELVKPSRKDWKKFKREMLEKWLGEVKLNTEVYREADKKYEEFKKAKELEFEERRKVGLKIGSWEKAEDPERFGGFRGQKWFDEMLWELEIFPHHSDLKAGSLLTLEQWSLLRQKIEEMGLASQEACQKWLAIRNRVEIGFDIEVYKLGHFEIKTLPFKIFRGKREEVTDINIKATPWHSKPSTYLCVIRTCDQSMETFQLVGWLYEHEVFKLPEAEDVARMLDRPSFYYVEVKDLHSPKKLLEMFLRLSKRNPHAMRKRA